MHSLYSAVVLYVHLLPVPSLSVSGWLFLLPHMNTMLAPTRAVEMAIRLIPVFSAARGRLGAPTRRVCCCCCLLRRPVSVSRPGWPKLNLAGRVRRCLLWRVLRKGLRDREVDLEADLDVELGVEGVLSENGIDGSEFGDCVDHAPRDVVQPPAWRQLREIPLSTPRGRKGWRGPGVGQGRKIRCSIQPKGAQ